MHKVAVIIDTENDAFVEYPASEVGRILRQLANKITDSGEVVSQPLRDINGNTVGEVRVHESVETE